MADQTNKETRRGGVYSKRDTAISTARMIATILVFLCHTFEEVGSISKKPVISSIGNYCSVGVPIFLMISGYLLGRTNYKGLEIEAPQTGRRIRKVLLDFYVYSILFVIPLYWFFVRDSVTIKAFLYTLMGRFFYPKLSHFWYIPYILLCYLMTPILKIIKEYLKARFPNIRKFIASICLIFLIMFICSKVYKWYFQTIYLFCYIFAFCLPDILRWKGGHRNMNRMILILAPFCVIANTLKIYCKNILRLRLEGVGGEFLNVLYDVSHFLLGLELFLLIYFLSSKWKIPRSKVMEHILNVSDKYSYDFYITHMLYVKGILSVMRVTNNYIFNIVLGFTLTMLSAVILRYVCELIKTFSIAVSKKLDGLRKIAA